MTRPTASSKLSRGGEWHADGVAARSSGFDVHALRRWRRAHLCHIRYGHARGKLNFKGRRSGNVVCNDVGAARASQEDFVHRPELGLGPKKQVAVRIS